MTRKVIIVCDGCGKEVSEVGGEYPSAQMMKIEWMLTVPSSAKPCVVTQPSEILSSGSAELCNDCRVKMETQIDPRIWRTPSSELKP